jgi:N-acetylglucosaminyldiphosphoundecaprenol N-acetyl-beta-D-mannosaminyltransferase
MKVEVLGVKIDRIDFAATLNLIKDWVRGEEQKFVATVNPEFLVEAQSNEHFKAVLNSVDLATCDGFGLSLAGRFLHGVKLSRVTGSDLSLSLFNDRDFGFKIFLLGGTAEVIEVLNKKFVQGNLVGSSDGGRLNQDYKLENNEQILEQIRQSGANILLVAFGQVKQEFWIRENLAALPNIKVAIGVGGTFDFLAGKLKRAPNWMRKSGLEWLYRLVSEPKRFGRIWRATAVFSWLVMKEKFSK